MICDLILYLKSFLTVHMMHPRILFTVIFFSAFTLLNGQRAFQPGYIIDINGDTINGLIENTGEIGNSRMCLFKDSEQSEAREYLPGAISGYRFRDGKYYVSKLLSMDVEPRMLFAECLVKGVATLYYLRNEGGDFYFIEKEGPGMVALTNEVREVLVNGTKTMVHSNSYIRMLKATFSDCSEIQSSIDHVQLNHRSLKSITCEYNEYMGGGRECITYEQGSRIKLRLAPFIGFSINRLSMSGDKPYDDFDFESSNDPVLGLLLELSSSRLGNHLSFQLGTEFSKNDFYAYSEQENLSQTEITYYNAYMQGLSIKITGGVKYYLTRGRVRPSLGGGLMFHKYIQPDFRYEWELHRFAIVTDGEWHPDLLSNGFYGAYLQAGLDVRLTGRLVLFAQVKGAYSTCDPKTVAGGLTADQIRIRSQVIPLTFTLGLSF